MTLCTNLRRIMIWKQEASIEILNQFQKNTLGTHLGIQFSEIGDDFIKANMPVNHRTRQPMGLLHGGASATLSETLGSTASYLCIDDINNKSVVGIEINANHLRPVRSGTVTGIVTPVKVGKRIHVWNINIFHQNELIAVSSLTVAVINRNH